MPQKVTSLEKSINIYGAGMIKNIGRELIDAEAKAAIENNPYSIKDMLKPPEYILEYAVRKNPDVISLIKNPSDQLCKIAILLQGSTISEIPSNKQTYDLAVIAVKQNGRNIYLIDKKLVDKKLFQLAVNTSCNVFKDYNKYFDGLAPQAMIERIVKTHARGICYIPQSQITDELKIMAIKSKASSYAFIENPSKKVELTAALAILDQGTQPDLFSWNWKTSSQSIGDYIYWLKMNMVKTKLEELK